jgi:hypothetical protein
MRASPHYFRVLSQNEGAPPLFEGAPPLLWVLTTTNKHFSTSPNLPPPTCLQHQLIPPPPPYLGQGGTTYPSTPFDMKSSIAASCRDGLLTTSQAVTMNPRSQWSLFEFGKRLNCEEICIQKFSCCSYRIQKNDI